jgi:hypothetical protein
MAVRFDFLRHIVNRVLAEKKDLPRQVDSDVRKFVGRAEDKYRFSIYGGDPARLAEYLMSPDFEDLINLLKGAGLLDVVEEILKRTIEHYRDYPEVVRAAEARLKQLREGAVEGGDELLVVKRIVEQVAPLRARINSSDHGIRIDVDGSRITVYTDGEGAYRVSFELKGEMRVEGREELRDRLRMLLDLLEQGFRP